MVLDSYQLSFAQIVQNICGHLCKAITNKHLQRFELNSTLSRRYIRLGHLNFGISDLFPAEAGFSSFVFPIYPG